jgi:ATP-dependent exoDNAse (exonuclease V) alpha subunit
MLTTQQQVEKLQEAIALLMDVDALVQAVRPDAKLFLLGDHDQLASVEAGSVLADLVRAQHALHVEVVHGEIGVAGHGRRCEAG